MNILNETAPARGVLASLRALTRGPIATLDDLRHVTREQATLLSRLLAVPFHEIPEHLPKLIPNIRIEYIADIPLPGIAFWTRQHWHIHVRSSDPVQSQVATVLRELKRIIDHPLRAELGNITGEEWEVLTFQFADDVLAATALPVNPQMEVVP